jgi:hypothetical protein
MDSTTRLSNLREDFLATSTQSMPIAGMLYWAVVGVAALRPPKTCSTTCPSAMRTARTRAAWTS